jgi:small-conductance mechanosensitive channel
MNNFWQQIYFCNSIQDWVIAVGWVIVGFFILRLVRKTVLIRLKKWAAKTETTIDDLLIAGIQRSVLPMLYILILYSALNFLTIPDKITHKITSVIWVAVMFFILRIITSSVKYFIFAALQEKKEGSEARQKQARGLVIILSVTIWVLGFIFLLDNLGYNIGTLIAGLGIGGIAIALAAQTILGDLFSYFVIFFDKPFEIGDFITIDDKTGTIEYIGLKTTRLRTLGGEQLICSNKDLTNSRVHNFGRMQKRRIVFKFGVIYQTSADQLKNISTIVKKIIEGQQEVNFDRGHFVGFGDSCLNFEFVYYVLSADYTIYMDKHQDILLSIFESFEKENIEFAYPTQTLFLQSESTAIVKEISPKN